MAKLSNIKIYVLPASGEEWEKQTKRNKRNNKKKSILKAENHEKKEETAMVLNAFNDIAPVRG